MTARTIDGLQALCIAHAMKGQWSKRKDEKDTEHVKRVWRIFNETLDGADNILKEILEK